MRLFLIILSTIILIGCTLNDTDPVLKASVEACLSDSLKTLDFAEQTNFDWDELMVMGPYSRHEDLAAKHGVTFMRSKNSPIHNYDHYNLLVFFKDKQEVAYLELDRIADFEIGHQLVSRDAAVYRRSGDKMRYEHID